LRLSLIGFPVLFFRRFPQELRPPLPLSESIVTASRDNGLIIPALPSPSSEFVGFSLLLETEKIRIPMRSFLCWFVVVLLFSSGAAVAHDGWIEATPSGFTVGAGGK
jgi:hypothetical protein